MFSMAGERGSILPEHLYSKLKEACHYGSTYDREVIDIPLLSFGSLVMGVTLPPPLNVRTSGSVF